MAFLLALFLSVALARVYGQDQCPQPLGNAEQTPYSRVNSDLFLLDVDHPAQCDGTVEQLTYCVYNPFIAGNPSHDAYVAVFAPNESSGVYSLNSSFVRLRQMNNNIDNSFVFDCFTQQVNFIVQRNDVFGVCQIDPSGDFLIRRLHVVGSGGPDDSSPHVVRGSNDNCLQTTQIDTSVTGNAEPGYVLHISANIMTMSTEPPTTLSIPETSNPTTEMPTTVETTNPTVATATTVLMETSNPTTISSHTNSTMLGTQLPRSSIAAIAASAGVLMIVFIVTAIVAVAVIAVAIVQKRKRECAKGTLESDLRVLSPFEEGVRAFVPDNQLSEAPDNNTYNEVPNSSHEYPASNDSTPYEVPSQRNGGDRGGFPPIYENTSSRITSAQKGSRHQMKSNDDIYRNDAMAQRLYENDSFSAYQNQPIGFYSILSGPVAIYAELLKQNEVKDIYVNQTPYCAPATEENDLYRQIAAFGIKNIHDERLKMVKHLGSGQFGSVDQGVWRRPNGRSVDVAMKTLNEGASEQDKVRFLQEGAIMAQFRHPNIVSLYGVVCKGGHITLVTELIQKGDLFKYLLALHPSPGETLPPDTAIQLLMFSQHVALGMQYLSSKGFVHRDLAARNILVSSDNICKVADFGMSRDLADEQYYISHGGKIPVKWTAPEALHFKKYSTASDVWSYGCLLYEMWSIGCKPFQGAKNAQVLRRIESGYRLPPPPGCPRRVYELMIAAWHPEASRRPGFRDLLLGLMRNEEEILSISVSYDGSQALVLGAPLSEAVTLYPDLQNLYKR